MGVYVYALKGKTKSVEFPDGFIRQVGQLDFEFKPDFDAWNGALSPNYSAKDFVGYSQTAFRFYRSFLNRMDKRDSQEYVVEGKWEKGSRVLHYPLGVKWDYDTPDLAGDLVGYLVPADCKGKKGWRVAKGTTGYREFSYPFKPDEKFWIFQLVEERGPSHTIYHTLDTNYNRP
jgi:hypothetical protein